MLSNSSLVRIPALVADRRSCLELSLDPEQYGTDDTDLWMRVFARHGLYCSPARTAAYTVHPEHIMVADMGRNISEHVASVDFVDEG